MIKVSKRTALSPVKLNAALRQEKRGIEGPHEDSIKVVVRVRPLLKREIERSPECLVDIDNDQSIVLSPGVNSLQARKYREAQKFTFSKCLWSYDKRTSVPYADQNTVFAEVGSELLDNTLDGFNSCVIAYGQTGSGKTYTMMGTDDEDGLIPMVCRQLFTRLDQQVHTKVQVKISFIEIYQENVYDLLGNGSKLRVRENSERIPFIENLNEYNVSDSREIMKLLNEGFEKRTTAETHLNKQSSRSHSILTVTVVQEKFDPATGSLVKLKSNLKLVDLAGSEKFVASDGLDKTRQQEGSRINKSLVTLGRVLTILSQRPTKKTVIPYRDSILTWLLKENIGGNSKTIMIACVSPTDFDETLSTLRFATITSRIENQVQVNKESRSNMDEMVKQFQLEKAKLLECISELKQMDSRSDELRKLENYVEWQNNYIDTLTFTNSVTQRQLSSSLRAAQKRNELLMSSLMLTLKGSETGPNEATDELSKLIDKLHRLDIKSPLRDIEKDLQSDLVMTYSANVIDDMM
ncbi:hypothetical protein KL948_003903 [Ogataea haglerorum]|nr:hypothetical protein KL951_001797 [Ogataea haglerorum]KAG7728866.1 hypothetical protein KL948_003903 [Ogataea haglerorum]KAG7737931.1 hypothetical protein KL923_003478 [Ogataea haglerorum]KAG7747102.1 hypothetical protein KL912_003714 [Ogataea haglerorum]